MCDTTFRTKKHLAHHVFNKHKEKESMQCNSKSDDIQCTYETTSVSNLNKHKKCDQCTFHYETDDVVEMAHYRVYDFEKTHGYLVSVRKMQTEIAAVKQRLLLEHLNSVHLR